MSVYKSAILLGSAFATCLLVPYAAHAGSGTAELLLSGVRSLTVVDMGNTSVTAGGASGTLTVVSGSGEPFPGNQSGAVQCAIFARKSSAGFDLEADCAASFSPEDKLFLVFKRKTGDLAAGTAAEGVEQIAGGTGRFAGVSGECKYVVENFPANWSVTTSKCQWQR